MAATGTPRTRLDADYILELMSGRCMIIKPAIVFLDILVKLPVVFARTLLDLGFIKLIHFFFVWCYAHKFSLVLFWLCLFGKMDYLLLPACSFQTVVLPVA